MLPIQETAAITASKQEKLIHGKVNTALNIQGINFDVELLVLQPLSHDIILGYDTLKRYQAIVDARNNKISLRNIIHTCSLPLNQRIQPIGYPEIATVMDISLALEQLSSEALSSDQLSDLKLILQKYKSVFAPDPKAPAAAIGVTISIDTGNSAPLKARPYRYSEKIRQIIKEEVTIMLEAGIIRPSFSPWSSPVTIVSKSDGSNRFCVDYRALNAITKKDSYPMPHIDDLLDKLSGSQCFSTIDLASGYWQICVEEASIEKTAFITDFGLFEFLRMPFGLASAPAVFQRMMSTILAPFNFAHAYLDDIIISSPSFPEHLDHLSAVLSQLSEFNLSAKLSKCAFGKCEIK